MPNFWTILGWVFLVAAPLSLFAPLTGRAQHGIIRGALGAVVFMVIGIIILTAVDQAPSKETIQYYVYGSAVFGALVLAARVYEVIATPSGKRMRRMEKTSAVDGEVGLREPIDRDGQWRSNRAFESTNDDYDEDDGSESDRDAPSARWPQKVDLRQSAYRIDQEDQAELHPGGWVSKLDQRPLKITYIDLRHQKTVRNVNVIRVAGETDGAGGRRATSMLCYCFEAEDVRRFLLSGIRKAIDGETGKEVLDMNRWLIQRAK